MNIDTNDPRITAFALGELQGRDAIEMARAVHADSQVRAAVDEVRATSMNLMEVFGAGEAPVLTADQRKTIRSAGGGAVIADIASARVPVWKKPMVVGMGVAAAVGMMLFIVLERSKNGAGGGGGQEVAGADTELILQQEGREWLRELSDHGMSLQGGQWQKVNSGTLLNVPLRSGADRAGSGSWDQLQSDVNDRQTLPSKSMIHLDSMVNHFQYQHPKMLSAGGWVADMEICNLPWNQKTMLLAVHTKPAIVGEDPSDLVSLRVNPARIQRVRILGYIFVPSGGEASPTSPLADEEKRTEGAYVLYELEPVTSSTDQRDSGPLATLVIGENATLPVRDSGDWTSGASSDIRFASVIAGAGMLLSGNTASAVSTISEGLDAAGLRESLRDVESDLGSDHLPADRVKQRREALTLIKKTMDMLGAAK